MRNKNRFSFLLAGLLAGGLRAAPPADVAKSASDVEISTVAATVPVVDETGDAGADVFLSLTRKAEPRKRLPTNVSSLTARDMELQGAAAVDAALDAVPSVLVQRSGTLGTFSTVRLRGSPSSAQQQVLLDDMPLLGVSNQFFDFSQLPLAGIERVEVVRGGASALYGANAIGGVVHLISKRPVSDRPETRFRMQVGSFMSQLYEGEFGARVGATDFYVTGGRTLSDGFQDNQDTDNLYATGRAGFSFGNGARVSADVGVVDGEVGNPRGTLLPVGEWNGEKERTALDKNARVEQRAVRSHGTVFLPLGETSSVQTAFYGTDQTYQTLPSGSAPPDFKQVNRIVGNDTRLVFHRWLTLGGSVERDDQKTDANAYAPERANHITNVAGYAQAQLAAGPWEVLPAVRYDDHSAFGGVWNPRLTALFHMNEKVKFSGNASRSYRAPSFLELYYVDPYFSGNPNLGPERAWSYDVGVEVLPGKSSRMSVTGFYTKIEDRVTVTSNFLTYQNAPSAEMSGVEVENRHRLLPHWTGVLAYTYTRAEGNSLASSDYVPLRLTPRHMADYQLTWGPSPSLALTNGVRYVSKQYQGDNQTGLDLPCYATWNARVSKKILAAEFHLAVENILNRRYARSFDNDPVTFAASRNPQPDRTFWTGVTIGFSN